jgi:uncharacterized repeat protein (TIGR01451 family)
VLNVTVTGIYTVGLRVTDAEGTTGTAQQTLTVVPAPLHHFVVSVPPTGIAGIGFTTVITAEDEYDNVIADWDADVSLTTTNGGIISPSVAAGSGFVDGVWSGLVSLTAAGTNRDVIASYDGVADQDTLDIEPAAASEFVFSSIGQQTAGVESGLFGLTAYDPYGNLDANYDGIKSLTWSGLMTSPKGDAPIYPSDLLQFQDGESDLTRFTAFSAQTNAVLEVVADDGPSGSSNPFTVTHAPASTFVFSTIPDQIAGSPGLMILTVEDDYGNLATGYTGPHALDWGGLGISPNGDEPDYPPDPVSFSSGSASFLVFTPYLAEADVQLTVAEGASVAGASNPFTVYVGSQMDEIVIESIPDVAGVEVTTHDMVVFEEFTVYAAGYDAWGNYIADQLVEWSGTGVAEGRVSPTSGTGTTLTPVISGTGTIEAQFSPTITDATGLITVRAPVLGVTLVDSVEVVEAGETLTYTLVYTNTGNAIATDTVLTLTLDSNLTGLVATPPPDSGSGSVHSWDLGQLGTGEFGQVFVTVTVTVPVDNGTVLTSVAEIDSHQTEVVSDGETTTVHSQPVLHIAKSDDPDPVPADNNIAYTIAISNMCQPTPLSCGPEMAYPWAVRSPGTWAH